MAHFRIAGVVALCAVGAACEYGIDLRKLRPDARVAPTCVATPDRPSPGCLPGPVQICRNQRADWTVVLPADAAFHELEIIGAQAMQQAAAVDWNDSAGGLAGFVVSITAPGETAEELASRLVELVRGSGGFKEVLVEAAGTRRLSHDGYPMVARSSLTLTPASSTELYRVRNRLFPALLGLNIAQIVGLPRALVESSDRFRLLLSTVVRPDGRAIVVGGVATLDGFANLLGRSRLRAEDMAGGTLVSRAAARTAAHCETFAFGAPAEVDMLWVVDGSDATTISNARVRLHGAAGALWNRAHSYSIDLRVAVVDAGQTKEVSLCSPKPSADCPAAGQGRFFGAGDLACFQACLLRPSGIRDPQPGHHGLESAKNTLLSLLARTDGDPRKLREDARVAVMFASDVEDGGVADLFGGAVPDPVTPQALQQVAKLIQPMVNLFTTSPGSELAGTVAHALVVDPDIDPSCDGRRGTGYIELVTALGGNHDLLCQAQPALDALMERKVDELAPLASLLALRNRPAAATLSARLNGASIFRSLRKGFDYSPQRGVLLLRGLADALAVSGNRIELSYVGW